MHRPDVTDRADRRRRDFPELPADIYHFSGLFGQLVTVFPTQDIVDRAHRPGPGPRARRQASWENELYKRVLASMTDQT